MSLSRQKYVGQNNVILGNGGGAGIGHHRFHHHQHSSHHPASSSQDHHRQAHPSNTQVLHQHTDHNMPSAIRKNRLQNIFFWPRWKFLRFVTPYRSSIQWGCFPPFFAFDEANDELHWLFNLDCDLSRTDTWTRFVFYFWGYFFSYFQACRGPSLSFLNDLIA